VSEPAAPSDDALLQVEKIVPGGEALARLASGQPVFLRRAAPGDLVRVRRLEKQRGRLVAEEFELVEVGFSRVTPECPVAERCGGCDLMHLARPFELEQKASMLQEALQRISGDAQHSPAALVNAGAPLGYRARVRFHIDEQGQIGFHARGTNQLVVIPSCAVAAQAINTALSTIRRLGRRFPGALASFRELELRAAECGVLARFVPREGIRPLRAEPLLRALGSEIEYAATDREAAQIEERRRLQTPAGEVWLSIPLDAFSQINPAVNAELVQAVLDGARARKLTSFCDLFSGAGNFALPLLKLGLSGVMVERVGSALQAAKRAAREQGLSGLRTRAADAAQAVKDMVREGKSFDLLLLDPPRDGAAAVLEELPGLSARAIAYVGCDPVTFARDLKRLRELEYRVSSVAAFDMFPRTHHFECLAWLDIEGARPSGAAPT
jgi:23S rRNA (uracil1939-C5)-methyltransferase